MSNFVQRCEWNPCNRDVIVGNLTNFVKNTLFLPDAVKTACNLEVSTLFHILLTSFTSVMNAIRSLLDKKPWVEGQYGEVVFYDFFTNFEIFAYLRVNGNMTC